MRKYAGKVIALFTAAAAAITLSGCSSVSEEAMIPLMGLSWFMSEDQVRETISENAVFEEVREKEDETADQILVDCSGVSLFDAGCTMTLCFTDQGLVGLNYHDMEREKNFAGWYDELEEVYGVPSERGSGIASWYSDPLGKNTAIYLFNLENEIQVSFYASGDTPDKSYGDLHIPAPEIRQPVVPFYEFGNISPVVTHDTENNERSEEPEISSSNNSNTGGSVNNSSVSGAPDNNVPGNDEVYDISDDDVSEKTDDVSVSVTESSQQPPEVTTGTDEKPVTEVTTTVTEKPPVTLPPVRIEKGDDYTLDNSLRFYMSEEEGKAKMSSYKMTDSYRIEEPGEPWEAISEYSGVTFRGKKCDAVLCYTSRGLVGINYFGSSSSEYSYWLNTVRGIYGTPSYSENGYSAWERNINGSEVVICVFRLNDSVQISFFADDSGSEITK